MRGFISLPNLADFDMVASLLVATSFIAAFVYTMVGAGSPVA